SIELPSALSGSNELITWLGAASTRMVPVCAPVVPAPDWAVPLCARRKKTVIGMAAPLSSFRAEIRLTTFRYCTGIESRIVRSLALLRSKRKLQRRLSDPTVAGICDLADIAIDLTSRIRELSVVEHIEEFQTKLESAGFADTSVLVQREVPIIDSGAVEEAALCITHHTERLGSKWGRIEV